MINLFSSYKPFDRNHWTSRWILSHTLQKNKLEPSAFDSPEPRLILDRITLFQTATEI